MSNKVTSGDGHGLGSLIGETCYGGGRASERGGRRGRGGKRRLGSSRPAGGGGGKAGTWAGGLLWRQQRTPSSAAGIKHISFPDGTRAAPGGRGLGSGSEGQEAGAGCCEQGSRWGRALGLAGRGCEAVEKAGSRVGWTGRACGHKKAWY